MIVVSRHFPDDPPSISEGCVPELLRQPPFLGEFSRLVEAAFGCRGVTSSRQHVTDCEEEIAARRVVDGQRQRQLVETRRLLERQR